MSIKNSDRANTMQLCINVAGEVLVNNDLTNKALIEIKSRLTGEYRFDVKSLILDNMNLVAYAARLRNTTKQFRWNAR